jgi:FkbM family methyltransferase
MLSTSRKIEIARALSRVVVSIRGFLGLPSKLIATRRDVTWSLDLTEGIDLAIFLLGGFEVRTLRRYAQLVRNGDVVLDIGANVGAHTLPLAQLVGASGRVYSFEPTAFAFAKQQANIALNPQIGGRISAQQMMLVARDADPLPDSVYSSWPLGAAEDLHGEHHGRLKDTQGSSKGTLDDFVRNADIERVDFIKLDVDGNESDVLAGGADTIRTSRPKIMLELAPYVYAAAPAKFDQLLDSLWDKGYELSDMATARLLPRDPAAVRRLIPTAGGMNVLAAPAT